MPCGVWWEGADPTWQVMQTVTDLAHGPCDCCHSWTVWLLLLAALWPVSLVDRSCSRTMWPVSHVDCVTDLARGPCERSCTRPVWPVSLVDCCAALPVGFYAKIVSAVRSPHAALSGSGVSLKCVCECVFYYFSLVLKKTLSSILSHQEIRPRFPGHLRCDWEQISGASEKLFCKLSTPLQHRWSFTRMGGRARERREWSQ